MATLVPLDLPWNPVSENPDHRPKKKRKKKRAVQRGDAFEDTALKTGFAIVEF